MTLLETKDLSAEITTLGGERKKVLRAVTLGLDAGSTTILMGPNGAGKSTLANVLMGSAEYKITDGNILYNGEDITKLDAAERGRRGIFLSFQTPSEVAGLSLELFIREAVSAIKGERVKLFAFQKSLKEKMDALGLDSTYAERDLNVGFSGGEKKKSEILQLLMIQPKLAILDEIDSGLDVDAVETVARALVEYQATGGTLLIITHSTRLLKAIRVDKTLILTDGAIVKTGDSSLIDYIDKNGFDAIKKGEGSENG